MGGSFPPAADARRRCDRRDESHWHHRGPGDFAPARHGLLATCQGPPQGATDPPKWVPGQDVLGL